MAAIVKLYRGENRYDFLAAWKWGVRISVVMFAISVLSLGLRHLNLGIDFEGGALWTVKAPNATVEQTRAALTPFGLGEAKIQTTSNGMVRVEAAEQSPEVDTQVRQALATLGNVPVTDIQAKNVGPTWGGEVTTSAFRALVVFLVCILGYVTMTFRGDYKLAVGVVVAVLHDVIISVGVYSIFQFEVTPATVIAFLTILGYSIYDTVVVYDKVQENASRVGMAQRMTYSDMMSLSMNQVLMRSINTSVVAVLPVLSTLIVGALLLGARTLEEFAIALTVGLVIGAYSSIFVAAPVVAFMKEREPRYRQLRERLGRGEGGPVPAGAVATSTATGEGTTSGTAGGASPARPAGGYSSNHPPRPRKQGKRR